MVLNGKWTSIQGAVLANSTSDISLIGKELELELNNLINGCTMQGDAHDELHKILVDYIPAIKILKITPIKNNLNHST